MSYAPNKAMSALRAWQEKRRRTSGGEPYQVPTYEEFCQIVQAIEKDNAYWSEQGWYQQPLQGSPRATPQGHCPATRSGKPG